MEFDEGRAAAGQELNGTQVICRHQSVSYPNATTAPHARPRPCARTSSFALVVWGKNGDMKTAYNAAEGPIGPALVPTLVSDALNRHVAVMLAKDEIGGDADSM